MAPLKRVLAKLRLLLSCYRCYLYPPTKGILVWSRPCLPGTTGGLGGGQAGVGGAGVHQGALQPKVALQISRMILILAKPSKWLGELLPYVVLESNEGNWAKGKGTIQFLYILFALFLLNNL